MKTWAAMYALIWLAFAQIILVLFQPFQYVVYIPIHGVIGAAILALAFHNQRALRRTSCPDRIKRITRSTFVLAILQGLLGLALAAGIGLGWGSLYTTIVSFLHVAIALAIITQASSSATAFDMWEEKEFLPAPT